MLQRLRVLVPFSPPGFGRQLGRDVVVEDVLVAALLVACVRPPVCEELARCGDHRRDEDEELDGDVRGDERGREAAKRVGRDDEVGPVADGLDDRVDVRRPAGRAVLAGEIDGDGVVPVLTQVGGDQVLGVICEGPATAAS